MAKMGQDQIGVIKNDIEFDYRLDDPYAGIIFATLRKGEFVKLSNPRIGNFDTVYYDGLITEGEHSGVVLNIADYDVDIIDTTWKKIR